MREQTKCASRHGDHLLFSLKICFSTSYNLQLLGIIVKQRITAILKCYVGTSMSVLHHNWCSGDNNTHYHTSHKCTEVNGEALQLHTARAIFFYCKSRRIRISMTSYACYVRTYKKKQRFLLWNHYHYSTKLYWKKYHLFVAVGIVTRAA